MQEQTNRELDDIETRYVRAASAYRQVRDERVATWRDMIHNAMLEVTGIDHRLLHDVMNDMDRFLNTSKRGPLTD